MPEQKLGNIRTFRRGPFTVSVDAYEDYDCEQYRDQSVLDDIIEGKLVVFRVEATLKLYDFELATEHLGGCVYDDIGNFMDHVGLAQLSRKDGRSYGSYFRQMVTAVLSDGRKEAIKLRQNMLTLKLRGAPALPTTTAVPATAVVKKPTRTTYFENGNWVSAAVSPLLTPKET